MTKKCITCGRAYVTFHAKRKNCSRECSNVSRTTSKLIPCTICGNLVRKPPSQLRFRYSYCSAKCMGKHRTTDIWRGPNHHLWHRPGKNKGIPRPEAVKRKIAVAHLGEKNPMWRGPRVGYKALHTWVRRHLAKPNACSNCHQNKPLDLANISQKYKRDFRDWEWLCRKCHMTKDGRMANLKRGRGTD